MPARPSAARIVVVGAGMGGLAAALSLAARGFAVRVFERASEPGGKLRVRLVQGAAIDSGPTVFTLREAFDELFAAADARMEEHVRLQPLETLARHAWSESQRLDLYSDPSRTAAAIGAFAGAREARAYERFARDAQRIYETLERSFLTASRPSMGQLVGRVGLGRLPALLAIRPFATLWQTLGKYFRDPRLRQLFARYATYCGSSPFAAPATMMLIAHVERKGVWSVEGGMQELPRALSRLASSRGAAFTYGREVKRVIVRDGRACGVDLGGGEFVPADAVVVNTDIAAIAAGLLGEELVRAVPATALGTRSLSAITWSARVRCDGFPLLRHNVFFSRDYPAEFAELGRRKLASDPTVYVCAQDRGGLEQPPAGGAGERLLCLINAPATGDRAAPGREEIEWCQERVSGVLRRCGARLELTPPAALSITTPADFHELFPGTGGALYGQATQGWRAVFRRPGSRTPLQGLYLTGGSVHPGPGLPMAALSGRLAATSVCADLDSMSRSRHVAMPGGISTA